MNLHESEIFKTSTVLTMNFRRVFSSEDGNVVLFALNNGSEQTWDDHQSSKFEICSNSSKND